MQIQRFPLLLVPLALPGTAWSDDTPQLTIGVEPAVAAISPLADGRRVVQLPTLEYEFAVNAGCGPDDTPSSVSLSIADTRRTLAGNEIPDGAPINAAITLPAQQIAPVVVDGFCSAAAGTESDAERLIRGVVTAHFSLRCTGAAGESITYASRSLDVLLVCKREPEAQSAPESTDR